MKGLVFAVASALTLVASAKITVDSSTVLGPVKPVNAVGQPPMLGGPYNYSLTHYLKEAGIPYARLHDVGHWLGGGFYVDIPNLFPNFDADENDPKNYVFDMTDILLKELERQGVEPFFRLGITIENWVCEKSHQVAARRSYPPKDYAKWARIAEHVIRHYTEGWAKGYHMKINYWEIWNEPENSPEIDMNPMWQGDWKSFCDFYGTVAPYLKQKFPHLKIGGYGSCGFYAGVGAGHVKAANSSPRMRYFVDCAKEFLERARQEQWPLDFFSYHSYSGPAEALRQVKYARDLLDLYGFKNTETCFNEWLPWPDHRSLGTARQAALIAAEMIGLENGPCDMAMIYDARCGLGNYSPLFNPLTYEPHLAYYTFVAFNELRKLGQAVKCECDVEGLYATAASDGKGRAAVMIANISGKAQKLACEVNGMRLVAAHLIDANNRYAEVSRPLNIADNSILVLEYAE